MFLEKIGKFCFSEKRALLFYLILSLPVIFGAFYAFGQYKQIQILEERFIRACKKGSIAIERKQKKEEFIQRYSNANPYFLDEKIESLVFLGNEISDLEKLEKHPAISDNREITSRLDFLKNGMNRLSFVEESIRSNGSIKETEEKQKHSVQMNREDLKKLLSSLENIPIEDFFVSDHRPQIVITDFRFEKRQTPIKTDVFEVDMQFIKREFIP